jgi:uncharacterized membrane protein YgcG
MQTIIRVTAITFIGLFISCGTEKKIEASPKIEDRIIDYSLILTRPQKDGIFDLITKLDQEIGSQIAVLTVDTLGQEKLEEFSLRMAETLRIGRSTHNDGLLITIVTVDRKVRIEVGTGLENILRDEIAARIIRDDMAPWFRKENYGRGIYIAVDKIVKLITENKELVGTEPR